MKIIMLSSTCGHHFEKECQACTATKESNDYRLRKLDLYEAALREADDTLRKLAADLAEEGAELHAQRIAVIELSVEQIDAALNSTDTGA